LWTSPVQGDTRSLLRLVSCGLRSKARDIAYLGGGGGSEDGVVGGRLSDPVRSLGNTSKVDS
jgi:hypothetical protein